MTFHQIKQTVFNPLLSTKKSIKDYLKGNYTAGTAHPYRNNGNKQIIVYTGNNNFKEMDISDKQSSFFIDTANLNEIGDVLSQRMLNHKNSLKEMTDYTITSINGNVIDIPLINDKVFCIALSLNNQPSYYDLGCGNINGQVLCYNSTVNNNFPGLQHSGDLQNGNILLHTIKFTAQMNNEPNCLFVSGYNKNPLHRYIGQRTSVLLVNHQTQTMYMISIPLDKASIGESSICSPVVFKRIGDKVRFIILSKPSILSNVNVNGAKLAGGDECFANAINIADTQDVTLHDKVAIKEEKIINIETPTNNTVNIDLGDIITIVENGQELIKEISNYKSIIHFGQGLQIEHGKFNKKSACDIVFPIINGITLSGPLMLALGEEYNGPQYSEKMLTDHYNNSKGIIVITSDQMNDRCRDLNPDIKINGLFVLVPHNTPDLKIIENRQLLENYLNNLNINSITALSGSMSLVTVKLGERYFFYRGVKWDNFMDKIPDFGQDVTNLIEKYEKYCTEEAMKDSWEKVVSLKERNIYFKNKKVKVEQVINMFDKMGFDDILHHESSIRDILTQLQIIMTTDEVKMFSDKGIQLLRNKIDDYIKPIRLEYIQVVRNRPESDDNVIQQNYQSHKSTLYGNYKKADRQCRESTNWLISALLNLVSSRNSSTKKHDLNQIIRKNKIISNVDASKNMTAEDVGNILEEKCEEIGVIMGNVDSKILPNLLSKVGKGLFLSSANNNNDKLISIDKRSWLLSGLDANILLSISEKYNDHPLFTNNVSLAFPQTIQGNGVYHSTVPFPCYDEFVNLDDPSKVNWMEKCNDPSIAQIRILLRGMIANSTVSRKFSISPSSPDVGFFLVHMILQIMEEVSKLRVTVPTKDNFNDQTCQMMRGLFGQLLTILASGTRPLSMAWQMVMPNPNLEIPTTSQWWIYSKLCHLFAYTGWDRTNLINNIKLLLTRTIRKQLTDPITEPMRKSITELDKKKMEDNIKNKNKQLEFLSIAVEVVCYLQHNNLQSNQAKDIAKRMLELAPTNLSSKSGGYQQVVDYFEILEKYGSATQDKNEYILQVCSNIFFKRSAHFKKSKSKLLNAIDNENKEKVHTISENIINRIDELDEHWSGAKIKVKYQDVISDIKNNLNDLTPKHIRDMIAGDAERSRTPWRLNPEFEQNNNLALYNYVLTGKMTQFDEVKFEEDKKKNVTLSSKLSAIPKGNNAALLAENLKNETYITLYNKTGMAINDLEIFVCSLGINKNNGELNNKIKKIIEILLEGWRDTVEAESNAHKVW